MEISHADRMRQQQLIAQAMQSGMVSVPYALMKSYASLKMSELDVMIILQIMAFQQCEHIDFPTLDELQARITAPAPQVIAAIQRLVKTQIISIDEVVDDQTGIHSERYNLQALYMKLADSLLAERMQVERGSTSSSSSSKSNGGTKAQPEMTSVLARVKAATAKSTSSTGKDLYSIVEAEFGRPLTPMELETITSWIDKDQYHEEVILAALKEAVFAGKLSFRYIDRILIDWARHKITTAEMAKTYSQQFRQSR